MDSLSWEVAHFAPVIALLNDLEASDAELTDAARDLGACMALAADTGQTATVQRISRDLTLIEALRGVSGPNR